jgi:hypothetical protein
MKQGYTDPDSVKSRDASGSEPVWIRTYAVEWIRIRNTDPDPDFKIALQFKKERSIRLSSKTFFSVLRIRDVYPGS